MTSRVLVSAASKRLLFTTRLRLRTFSSISSYHCSQTNFRITDEMKATFSFNGYVILRRVLTLEEMVKLKEAIEQNGTLKSNSYYVGDGMEGRGSRLSIWCNPGHDITGIVARSEKIAGTMEQLLGGEVYHYHSKLIMKEALTGGSFVWHQDYGYWYQNGCLFPDMGTAFIAIDRCDEDNGCLQVLRGSNRLGRIEHGRVGGQTGADANRVNEILKHLPVDHVVLDPGDVLYFHCNLLHKSNRNESRRRRWALLSAYNRASNDPFIRHPWPTYTPLNKVPNSAILQCTNYTDMTGKGFVEPAMDKTVDGIR